MSRIVEIPSQSELLGAPALASAARSKLLVALFATTLFTSAFLMFIVEPMIARMVLPMLGGAPSVWNTCVVFFQAMLLAGYAYAHGATQYLGIRRHVIVHSIVLLLPLAVLPVVLRQAPPQSTDAPVSWLLLALLGAVGLPFFVLSTSAAVFQKWFSATDDEAAGDPYFLYTASNLGSFIALLAYPVLLEPTLRLQDQSRLWTVGYLIFVVLSLSCAAAVWRRGNLATASAMHTRAIADVASAVSWARRTRWIGLSFAPSSLLLAVTSYITTDVGSVPLLWIVPLALYLLAFVIAFSPGARRSRALATRFMPLLVVMLTLILVAQTTGPLAFIVPLHLVAFFTIATACHSDLANDRPHAGRLTEYYFWISFGGMLGGLFNALLAPVIFEGVAEYPLVIIMACLLRSGPDVPRTRRTLVADIAVPAAIGGAVAIAILVNNQFGSISRYIILGAAIPALVAFSQQRRRIRFAASIAAILLAGTLTESMFGRVVLADRTFFGVNRVREDERLGYRFIFHGTTLHGMQSLDRLRRDEPLSYFHREGPVGQVFAHVPIAKSTSKVGVIGLGIGTLAAYRLPHQQWTYYEIDPAVERIARDARYFTYLARCGDGCRVITGDGRVSLARAAPETFGLFLLDAFSSDAVPMHLLTKEAMDLYVSRLAPGGVMAFHISNMHLSFSGVLARIAGEAGLAARWQQEPGDAGAWEIGKFPSEWFLIARNERDFGSLVGDPRWKVPVAPPGTPLWTDDFSNILSVLRRGTAR